MDKIRVSKARTMPEEIALCDRRDARIEPLRYKCDKCSRRGYGFIWGFYLCRQHLRWELVRSIREVSA